MRVAEAQALVLRFCPLDLLVSRPILATNEKRTRPSERTYQLLTLLAAIHGLEWQETLATAAPHDLALRGDNTAPGVAGNFLVVQLRVQLPIVRLLATVERPPERVEAGDPAKPVFGRAVRFLKHIEGILCGDSVFAVASPVHDAVDGAAQGNHVPGDKAELRSFVRQLSRHADDPVSGPIFFAVFAVKGVGVAVEARWH